MACHLNMKCSFHKIQRDANYPAMKKILIVDDDPDLLDVMQIYLSTYGYKVIVADTCDDGLRTFYDEKPDLVVLDINVHDQDGREVCAKIKANAESNHIPIILVSGNQEALVTYESYGANAMIEKPFDFKLLDEKKHLYLTER